MTTSRARPTAVPGPVRVSNSRVLFLPVSPGALEGRSSEQAPHYASARMGLPAPSSRFPKFLRRRRWWSGCSACCSAWAHALTGSHQGRHPTLGPRPLSTVYSNCTAGREKQFLCLHQTSCLMISCSTLPLEFGAAARDGRHTRRAACLSRPKRPDFSPWPIKPAHASALRAGVKPPFLIWRPRSTPIYGYRVARARRLGLRPRVTRPTSPLMLSTQIFHSRLPAFAPPPLNLPLSCPPRPQLHNRLRWILNLASPPARIRFVDSPRKHERSRQGRAGRGPRCRYPLATIRALPT